MQAVNYLFSFLVDDFNKLTKYIKNNSIVKDEY